MIAALLFLLTLVSFSPAYAQTATGDVWGRVTAATGEPVDRATVTLTNVDTGADRETRTDDRGRFGFAAVPTGRYRVTAMHDGYAGRRQDDIVLVPGQRMQIELALRLAPLPETIALNPYPPIAESARTHASMFVAETEIQDLPLIGRRYLRLAELTPAVAQDPQTGGITVMSLPSNQNRVLIDGFDHTSSITGEPLGHEGPSRVPYQLSQATADSFRVETNGAPAANGRAAASIVNVVTRSGANAFHGSGYGFFGDRALNGRKALDEKADRPKPPYGNRQFGATLGGPVSREHNFFFFSYEGLRRTADVETDFVREVEDQRQDLLFARTDHDYAGQHVMLRYNDQRFDANDRVSFLRNRSGAASLASSLGYAVVNEARAQYGTTRDEESRDWTLFGAHRFETTRMQAGDTLSVIAGPHSLKAGGDVLKDRNDARLAPNPAIVTADVTQYAGFVQDAWRATSALTVDLGVRYDLQDFGGTVVRDTRNVAPRVGFAFSPGGRGKTVRGAYGLFYGSTPAFIPAMAQAFAGAAFVDPAFRQPRVHQASVGVEFEKYRAGSLGIDYLFARGERLPRAVDVGTIAGGRVVSFQSTAESIYNGITLHARARILQQLFYTIAYTVSRSDETPQQPIAMVFGDANARNALGMQGNALQARFPGNNDQHQHLSVSAMYDTSLLAEDKHGLSKRLLKDWEYGLVYTWHTSNPYSAFVGGDLNGDGNPFNDVAPGTTWNQYRLPFYGSLDPRVARRFRIGDTGQLSLIWEAFNLTNRPNYAAANTTLFVLNGSTLVRNPDFGSRTRQFEGRVMQLAARLIF